MTARSKLGVVVRSAGVLQALVLALTLLTGPLLWTGWPFAVAVVVAALGLGVIVWSGDHSHRPSHVIALLCLPVITLGVVAGLAALDARLAVSAACSDEELAAVAGLELPAGGPLTWQGTRDGVCEATVESDRGYNQLTTDIAEVARRSGWTITNPAAGPMAHKSGVLLFVEPVAGSQPGVRLSVRSEE